MIKTKINATPRLYFYKVVGISLSLFFVTGCSQYQYGSFFSKLPTAAVVQFGTTGTGNAFVVSKNVDFGNNALLTLATLEIIVQNTGELDATDLAFTVDDTTNFTVQANCPKLSALQKNTCTITVSFKPLSVDKIGTNLNLSYDNGNSATIKTVIPMTGVSLCWPSITADNMIIPAATTAGSPQPVWVHFEYNGDLVKNIGTLCPNFPHASVPTLEVFDLSIVYDGSTTPLTSSGVLTLTPPAATSTTNAPGVICGQNATQDIGASCYMQMMFNPTFSAISPPPPPTAEAQFLAQLTFLYNNTQSSNAETNTSVSAHALNEIFIADGYALTVNSPNVLTNGTTNVGSLIWNPSNYNADPTQSPTASVGLPFSLHFAPAGTTNVPATITSVTFPLVDGSNNSFYYQTASDISGTTCIQGQPASTAGCNFLYHFRPMAANTSGAAPAGSSFTSQFLVNYGFPTYEGTALTASLNVASNALTPVYIVVQNSAATTASLYDPTPNTNAYPNSLPPISPTPTPTIALQSLPAFQTQGYTNIGTPPSNSGSLYLRNVGGPISQLPFTVSSPSVGLFNVITSGLGSGQTSPCNSYINSTYSSTLNNACAIVAGFMSNVTAGTYSSTVNVVYQNGSTAWSPVRSFPVALMGSLTAHDRILSTVGTLNSPIADDFSSYSFTFPATIVGGATITKQITLSIFGSNSPTFGGIPTLPTGSGGFAISADPTKSCFNNAFTLPTTCNFDLSYTPASSSGTVTTSFPITYSEANQSISPTPQVTFTSVAAATEAVPTLYVINPAGAKTQTAAISNVPCGGSASTVLYYQNSSLNFLINWASSGTVSAGSGLTIANNCTNNSFVGAGSNCAITATYSPTPTQSPSGGASAPSASATFDVNYDVMTNNSSGTAISNTNASPSTLAAPLMTFNATGTYCPAPTVTAAPSPTSTATFSPAPVSYGQTPNTLSYTLTNTSPYFAVTLQSPTITTSDTQITVNNGCPTSLAASASCTITATYAPNFTASTFSSSSIASFSISYLDQGNSNNPVVIGPLHFAGSKSTAMSFTPSLTPNPAPTVTVNFGTVTPGVAVTRDLTLNNIFGSRANWITNAATGIQATEGSGSSTLEGLALPVNMSAGNQVGAVTILSNNCGTNTGAASSTSAGTCTITFKYLSTTGIGSWSGNLGLEYYNDMFSSTQSVLPIQFQGTNSGASGQLTGTPTSTITFPRRAAKLQSGSGFSTTAQDNSIVLTNSASSGISGTSVTIGSIGFASSSGGAGFTNSNFSFPQTLPSGTPSGEVLCTSGTVLAPQAKCTLPVLFRPQSIGTFTPTLYVSWLDNGNSSTTQNPLTFSLSGTGTQPVQVAAGGGNTCIITETGGARCWGSNSHGQLGINSSSATTTQATAAVITNDISFGGNGYPLQLAVGNAFVCAILGTTVSATEGSVYCWGANNLGQLGNSTSMNDQNAPSSPVSLGQNATAISAGYGHACAILHDGTVRCWGYNNGYQLGNGNTNNSNVMTNPTQVGLSTTATHIAAGVSQTCAILQGGAPECWGQNLYGQLGQGTITVFNSNYESIPAIMLGSSATATGIGLSSGSAFTCAIASDGSGVHCFGQTSAFNGTSLYSGLLGFALCRASTNDGPTHCWDSGAPTGSTCASQTTGTNIAGAACGFGINPSDISSGSAFAVPLPVSSGASVAQVAAGDAHACALTSDNKVGCWGINASGQLGNNSVTNVGAGSTDFSAGPFAWITGSGSHIPYSITAGSKHTCAAFADNTVVCWGEGSTDSANGTTSDTGSTSVSNISAVYNGNSTGND